MKEGTPNHLEAIRKHDLEWDHKINQEFDYERDLSKLWKEIIVLTCYNNPQAQYLTIENRRLGTLYRRNEKLFLELSKRIMDELGWRAFYDKILFKFVLFPKIEGVEPYVSYLISIYKELK